MRLRDVFSRFLGSTSSDAASSDHGDAVEPDIVATPDGDLALGYQPAADGDADPGEIVWTWVAYEDDPSRGKDRPVAVIGTYADGRVAGLMLTSKDHDGDPDYHLVGSGAGTTRVVRAGPSSTGSS